MPALVTATGHLGAGDQSHSLAAIELVKMIGEIGREDGTAQSLIVEQKRRVRLVLHQCRCQLSADESASDHGNIEIPSGELTQATIIIEPAEIDDTLAFRKVNLLLVSHR